MSADRIIEGFSMKKLFLDVSGKEFFFIISYFAAKNKYVFISNFFNKNYSIKIKRLSQ